MGTGSSRAPVIVLGFAAVLAISAYLIVFGFGDVAPSSSGLDGAPRRDASATPRPQPPVVAIAQDTCCTQAARFLRATWTVSVPITEATVSLSPDPGFACTAVVSSGGRAGTFGCAGLLRGATSYTATLTVTTGGGQFPFGHSFKTMGDRLTAVKWFTEFEDPNAEPLACAAASVRIVQNYTTGQDKATAEQILAQGQGLNRSRDPGLDPVAIAAIQKRLDARNNYHYYRFDSKEEATLAAAYWLVRSGKPVHAITLAGQHDPLVIGFEGNVGTSYGDPANRLIGMVVQDPQRGDVRPETAGRRPDKYRTVGFQTGQPLSMEEWYGDEWWFGFAYTSSLGGVNIDRNDGAYPAPHWPGKFVIIVDDADAEWPSDREGRVAFR